MSGDPEQRDLPPDPSDDSADGPELIAYALHEQPDVGLLPGPMARAWMEQTPERYANRCLPLLVANQAGWLLLNPQTVFLTWDGTPGLDGIAIEYDGAPPVTRATSHFGQGIVTFALPYLFRTSPGWNLWVKGPSNCPVDGLYALEGVVETDWAAATFTMNWQLTRPGLRAVLPGGEPLAMIVPQRRGELERVRPLVRSLAENPALEHDLRTWQQSRADFLHELPVPGSAAAQRKWEKDYFRGVQSAGRRAPEHQTRLRLAGFEPALPGPPGEHDE
jgi:hypothetical protein